MNKAEGSSWAGLALISQRGCVFILLWLLVSIAGWRKLVLLQAQLEVCFDTVLSFVVASKQPFEGRHHIPISQMGQEEHGWVIAGEFPAMQLWYHFSRKAFETFVLPSVTILTQCHCILCWWELFKLWVEMPRQLNIRHTLESISCNMWCRPEKFTSISNSTKLCTEAKVHLAQEGAVCHTPGEAYAQLSPKTWVRELRPAPVAGFCCA